MVNSPIPTISHGEVREFRTRGRWAPILAAVFPLIGLATGCDKIQEWQDAANGKAAPAPIATPTVTQAAPSPAPAPTPPPAPVKRDPAQVLARFRSLKPFEITDQELEAVASLDDTSEITELDLSKASITSKGIQSLGKLTSLRDLSLQNKPMSVEDMPVLSGLPNLNRMNVSGTRIELKFLENLQPMPQVTELVANDISIGPDAAKLLVELFPNLQVLELANTNVQDAGMDILTSLDNLRVLDLSGTKFYDPAMKNFNRLKDLEALYLNGCIVFNGTGLERVTTNLKRLAINDVALAESAIKNVARLKNLEYLSLARGRRFGDKEAAAILKGRPHLKELHLMGCSALTDKMVPIIASCKQLEVLSVDQIRFNNKQDASISKLAKDLPNLKRLSIIDCGVTAGTISKIRESHPDLVVATKLGE